MKTALIFTVISLALSAVVQGQHSPCHNISQTNNNNKSNVRLGEGARSKNGSNSTSSADGIASSATLTSTATDNASSATSTSTALNSNPTTTGSGGGDPQSSLTIDNNVLATGFENNGQNVPTAGQVASLTSPNNFINFCLTVPNLPITNGEQITTGSCNPAPMGMIPSTDNMPSAKFVFPSNGEDTLVENTEFTIQLAIQNVQTGSFVNPEENYLAAPQQLNSQGQIIGHSHIVVQSLSSINQSTPLDPKTFAFFMGVNSPAMNGILSAKVTGGLPAGSYRVSSMVAAANHQPVIVPVAKRGSPDDAVYITVKSNGNAGGASAPSAPTRSKGSKRFHPRALNY
jgi:hypothetical protein